MIPPLLMLLLLTFLSILTVTFSSSDDSSVVGCSSSAMCGAVNISYPFLLSPHGGIRPSASSAYCGYPGFVIDCQEDIHPILPIDSGHYYNVAHIDYDSRTINLTYTDDVLPDPNPRMSCPNHNVTFSREIASSSLTYSSADANLTFFFGCSVDFASWPDFQKNVISCPGYTDKSSFVFRSDKVPPEILDGACEDVVVAPVMPDTLRDLLSDPAHDFSEALSSGFQLAWPPVAPEGCEECESSGKWCGFNQTSGSALCVCSDGTLAPDCHVGNVSSKKITLRFDAGNVSHKMRTNKVVFIGIGSGLFVCLCLIAFVLKCKKSRDLLFCWKKKSKTSLSVESFIQKHGSLNTKWYKYSEIKRMTKSFTDKLGQGGYGIVYKGCLPNGHLVAVKMLKESKENGEEFINEVASISRTSHVNIVRLLGFCLDGSKRALVYDFMPNGSLERFIFTDRSQIESTLGWNKLFDIVVGVARGLEYLHRGCNTRIVHFDIKPHNILLDRDFCPKISDFGLAKLGTSNESIISLVGARGTIGYIAPEVFSRNFGVVSSKSDVYSYGMMVLEMVGGRKNLDVTAMSSSETYFPRHLYKNVNQYCVEACGDNGEAMEVVRKMILVALWCIQMMPDDRPSMSRVVNMLEGDTNDLQLPPKP